MANLDPLAELWDQFFQQRIRRHRSLAQSYVEFVARLAQADLPPIFELRHLSLLLGSERVRVASFIAKQDKHYRTFMLPKRRGGFRSIDIPVPELLYIQRWILRNILEKVATHQNAHGFIRERSIVTNASAHIGSRRLLKIDLLDFFGSIREKRGILLFLRLGYPPNVAFFLTSLCFKSGKLPQGSATSPAISNLIAKKLDEKLSALATESQLIYTRYADDISISGERVSVDTLEEACKAITSERFKINHDKTMILHPSSRKIITGVCVTDTGLRLPRDFARKVKKEAYYITKFGLISHTQHTDHFDPIQLERLIGRVHFWLYVDPKNITASRILKQLREYRSVLDRDLQSHIDVPLTSMIVQSTAS